MICEETLRKAWIELNHRERERQKDDRENQEALKWEGDETVDVVLSVMRPGRLYNNEDLRHRCKDVGYVLEDKTVTRAIRALKRDEKIVEIHENKGGKNKLGSVVMLVES